ncbi:hypothetical protein THAOC_26412, partial [Thalassiosira oceanica]
REYEEGAGKDDPSALGERAHREVEEYEGPKGLEGPLVVEGGRVVRRVGHDRERWGRYAQEAEPRQLEGRREDGRRERREQESVGLVVAEEGQSPAVPRRGPSLQVGQTFCHWCFHPAH